MKKSFLFISLLIGFFSFTQKNELKSYIFTYEVCFTDSVTKKTELSNFIIYTNDTIVRVEAENKLGKQITIKHLSLKKYYLLMEINNEKFAIQHQDSAKRSNYYEIRLLNKKGKINKIKGKKAIIIDTRSNRKQEIIYKTDIATKYNDIFSELPGLPLCYVLYTENGTYQYKIKKIENKALNRDLFGIPADYQKISFDDFLSKLMNQKKLE